MTQLIRLRDEMRQRGLDALWVSRPANVRYLTGFTGSAGVAVVLDRAAALFVDGRYTLQARAQTDPELFEVLQTPEAKPSAWLAGKVPKGAVVGYDPALHTIREIKRLTETLGKWLATDTAREMVRLKGLIEDGETRRGGERMSGTTRSS